MILLVLLLTGALVLLALAPLLCSFGMLFVHPATGTQKAPTPERMTRKQLANRSSAQSQERRAS
jgi:hypothetical protein